MKIVMLTLTRRSVSGGYGKYLRELVPRLRKHDAVSRLVTYVPPPMADADPGYRTWPDVGWPRLGRWLKREVAALQPDVVFIPSSVYLNFGSIPVVTMMRNMEPLDHPFSGNSWDERLRNAARALAARYACRRSARVIAVSRYVRERLVEQWRLDEERIAVVPHGVDTHLTPVRPAMMPEDRPFLFTAGSLRPARGLDDLAEALAGMRQATLPRLAVAGSVEDPSYVERIKSRLGDSAVKADVVWLGGLSASEMAWCFRNARLFVMTSRAEACPNTVLEAMAEGCLSVSTDQPPMPEFFGDAALYYRRRDGGDLARVIGKALTLDSDAEADLRRKAVERSRLFTWDATVEATVRELDRAVKSSPRPRG